MSIKKQTFQEYLEEQHMKGYHGTDDDSPDAFEAWVTNLQVDDIMDYAENWGMQVYESGFITGELMERKLHEPRQ